jgi:hypothetical protein
MKTLDECFTELIAHRGWWKESPYDRKSASVHKKLFLQGKLPDETKRIYLQVAGYEKAQPEMWRIKS